jgi:DNA-binding winged helix-turn-helix (wHTH) protein
MEHRHQSGPPSGQRFRIGRHVLFDVEHHCLWHISHPARRYVLEPVHAATLLKLVSRARTVLRWDQLVDPQWVSAGLAPDASSVALAVLAVREAFLHVDPDTAYVHGLPRLGYVLVADVERDPQDGARV